MGFWLLAFYVALSEPNIYGLTDFSINLPLFEQVKEMEELELRKFVEIPKALMLWT